MPRPIPVDYLQPDEKPILETGRHGLSVLDSIVGAFLLMAALVTGVLVWTLGFQPRFFLSIGVPAIATLVLLWLVFVVARTWRVMTSHYVVTPERVYISYGRLRFTVGQTTYDRLTDMHVHQSVWGRMFGFGTIRLETAGPGLTLDGVRRPFQVKQCVEQARTRFIQGLVGQERATRTPVDDGTRTEAGWQQMEDPETPWEGQPSLASVLWNLFMGSFLILLGLTGLAGATPTHAPVGYAFGSVMVLVGGGTLGTALVHYRCTRYRVGRTKVVVRRGWLSRRHVEATYDKVTDVDLHQSFMGRIFGFGTIRINTAGSNTAPVVFTGIAEPEKVQDLIEQARRGRSR